jgi:hypothetical protein
MEASFALVGGQDYARLPFFCKDVARSSILFVKMKGPEKSITPQTF